VIEIGKGSENSQLRNGIVASKCVFLLIFVGQ
jgi:hypothetical protein